MYVVERTLADGLLQMDGPPPCPKARGQERTGKQRLRGGACGNPGRSQHGGDTPTGTAGRLVAATAGRARLTPFGDQQELPTTAATTREGLTTGGNETVGGDPPLDRATNMLLGCGVVMVVELLSCGIVMSTQ